MTTRTTHHCNTCDRHEADYGISWTEDRQKLLLVSVAESDLHICATCLIGLADELAAITKAHEHE